MTVQAAFLLVTDIGKKTSSCSVAPASSGLSSSACGLADATGWSASVCYCVVGLMEFLVKLSLGVWCSLPTLNSVEKLEIR